jgi:hypothetical protein
VCRRHPPLFSSFDVECSVVAVCDASVAARREQVLLLWDRILAFDCLELLAVVAAAILLFRSSVLLETSDPAIVR